MKATGRYHEGARNRQAIIDHLHEHPGMIAPDIARHFGIGKATCAKRLADMCVAGELRRERTIYRVVNSSGHEQAKLTFAYWPLVMETRNKQPCQPKVRPPKWVTRNTDPERPVTPCPDAMQCTGHRSMTYLEAMG